MDDLYSSLDAHQLNQLVTVTSKVCSFTDKNEADNMQCANYHVNGELAWGHFLASQQTENGITIIDLKADVIYVYISNILRHCQTAVARIVYDNRGVSETFKFSFLEFFYPSIIHCEFICCHCRRLRGSERNNFSI